MKTYTLNTKKPYTHLQLHPRLKNSVWNPLERDFYMTNQRFSAAHIRKRHLTTCCCLFWDEKCNYLSGSPAGDYINEISSRLEADQLRFIGGVNVESAHEAFVLFRSHFPIQLFTVWIYHCSQILVSLMSYATVSSLWLVHAILNLKIIYSHFKWGGLFDYKR